MDDSTHRTNETCVTPTTPSSKRRDDRSHCSAGATGESTPPS